MSLSRALLLYRQDRNDLALEELGRHLAEAPDDGAALALRALCLAALERFDEAEASAGQAIGADPELAFAHHALGTVLCRRGRPRAALPHLEEALRLEPEEPQRHAAVGNAHLMRGLWKPALEAAEHGLALDPTDATCMDVRTLALVKLGRVAEASAGAAEALELDPDSATAHANLGWNHLGAGHPQEALESFREALRLDPDDAWAREGMIEALKARNILYRPLLRFFLWVGRFTPTHAILLVIGAFFIPRVMARIASAQPSLTPVASVVSVAYLGFVLVTWNVAHLMNLLLWTNRFGRACMTREHKESAALTALVLVGCGWIAVVSIAWKSVLVVPFIVLALSLVPLTAAHNCPDYDPLKRPLRIAGFAAPLVAVGVTLGAFVDDRLAALWVPLMYAEAGATWAVTALQVRWSRR